MPAGRPTKYKKRFCKEIVEYFSQNITKEEQIGGRTQLITQELPTLVGFAKLKGIGISTIFDWINVRHASFQSEFSAIVKNRCKPLQKNFLVNAGLLGLYNPQAFKFVAVNITDMVDRKDVGIEVGQEAKKFANWLADRDLPEGQAKELSESIDTPLPKQVESVEVESGG